MVTQTIISLDRVSLYSRLAAQQERLYDRKQWLRFKDELSNKATAQKRSLVGLFQCKSICEFFYSLVGTKCIDDDVQGIIEI